MKSRCVFYILKVQRRKLTMANSEIRTTKNIKLKEEDKMMKLDLYESRLFGRICYGFGMYGYNKFMISLKNRI